MNTRRRILVLAVLALLLLGLSTALALACPPPGTGTPGYWKNHPGAWPMEQITIGGVTYTKTEAIEKMNTSGKGDKTYTLFSALVAAELNWVLNWQPNDATNCPIPGTTFRIRNIMWQANGWLTENPLGSNVGGSSDAWQGGGEWKYKWLDAYNRGLLCVPSRDDFEND